LSISSKPAAQDECHSRAIQTESSLRAFAVTTRRYGFLALQRQVERPQIPVPAVPWKKSIPADSNALRMLVNVSAYGTERSDSNRAIDVCETPDRAERSSWLQESHARAART
jgi:hypothetical protein